MATGAARAFRDGVVVEALNLKTAAFVLAFIPQFVDPSQGRAALRFAALGLASVAPNTLVDVAVACAAARARDGLARRPGLVRRLREASGAVLCGLGASLAFARRTA